MPCLIRQVFHVDCPGCGIQRSFIALLQGHIYDSLRLYPALIPMLLFFVFLVADRKYHFTNSKLLIKSGMAFIFIIMFAAYIYKLTT